MKKTFCQHILCIVGPTAVGKSDIAYKLAKHFNCSILSFDSRQCFKELNIGCAKPDKHILHEVKHHFISSHALSDTVNAHVFEQYALDKINAENHEIMIAVGGTGLYLQALQQGLSAVDAIDPKVRKHWNEQLEQEGLDYLVQELEKVDKVYAEGIDTKNPRRVLKGLEVYYSSGKKMSDVLKEDKKVERNFTLKKIGIYMGREKLYVRINQRVLQMIDMGLEKEVVGLEQYRNHQALNTIGYKEIFDWRAGKYGSFETCVAKIQQHTRNYAKRQMTWFGRDNEIHWIDYSDVAAFEKLSEAWLRSEQEKG